MREKINKNIRQFHTSQALQQATITPTKTNQNCGILNKCEELKFGSV
jgi:hypothetical protein